MSPAGLESVRALYAQTAPHYEPAIAQPMSAFARSLAAWIARCVRENAQGTLYDPFDLPQRGVCPHVRLALDVGTGTGVLARHMAGFARRVIGVDISAPMLAVARAALRDAASPRIALWQADLHQLPLPRASVDVIGASFGLNHSAPRHALRELARVLRPHGLLLCQEWSALDALSQAFDVAFEQAIEVAGVSAAFDFNLPEAWQAHMQDVEDYYTALKAAGFSLVWAREAAFVRVRFPSVQAFIAYKLAWAPRRLPFQALAESAQQACLAKWQAALAPHCAEDGSLLWQPLLIRVCAVR
ncbi:MAG: methyltransferase domain-containing protein [Anaerolineae bacterium]|nr:methyltransferase domain-containing protein [Anaerolineae bacterium]